MTRYIIRQTPNEWQVVDRSTNSPVTTARDQRTAEGDCIILNRSGYQ